ncbi:glycosyltransferase [Planctomycetaceae bacterium SH139]
MITTHLGGGGAERHLVRIANVLARSFQLRIAVLRSGGSYREFLTTDIPVDTIGAKWSQRSTLLSSQLSIGKLARLIDNHKIDCCVSFLEPASYATGKAIARSGRQPAHLVSIQNNLSHALTSYQRGARRFFLSGIREAIRGADGIIAISQGVGSGVAAEIPDCANKVRVIHNAATDRKQPIGRGAIVAADRGRFKAPRKLVVACGRLTEQKGYGDLLAAVALAKQHVDLGLWILGEGPLRTVLQEQVIELGLSDRVIFQGFVPDPRVYFAAADAFVLSSWWEGFGNVIVEAMSVALPVIVTDCPYGPGEIVTTNETGVVVPPRDPQRLAEAIITLLNDDSLRNTLGNAGQGRAMDFSADDIGAQYQQLITATISNEPAKARSLP